MPVLADDALHTGLVVVGKHDSVGQGNQWRAGRVGHRARGSWRSGKLEIRLGRDLGEVVRPVIPALEARDLLLARVGPGEAHGEHGRLGPRVRESHHVQRGNALAQFLGELHLHRIGGRHRRATCELLRDRFTPFHRPSLDPAWLAWGLVWLLIFPTIGAVVSLKFNRPELLSETYARLKRLFGAP